jgi:aspartate aminotransferase-like enzyme
VTTQLNFSPSAADARHLCREALKQPHFYSRQEEFNELVRDVSAGLKRLCHTDNPPLLLTSAGTGALECAIAALPPDMRVLVIRNGYFGHRLLEIAQLHHANVTVFDVPFGQALTENQAFSLATAMKTARPDVILCVHLETSSGMVNEMGLVGRLAREHGALFLVDGISAIGAVECHLDEWGVNCYVASAYKALACPAGLSFMMADEAFSQQANRRWSYYFDLPRLERSALNNQFLWSPNVLTLHCLLSALQRITGQAEDPYFRQIGHTAGLFREWLKAAGLEIFGDPRRLSPCFTVIQLPEPVAERWLAKLKQDYGIVIGKGIGEGADYYLRLGHYPIHDSGALKTVAAAMIKVMNFE